VNANDVTEGKRSELLLSDADGHHSVIGAAAGRRPEGSPGQPELSGEIPPDHWHDCGKRLAEVFPEVILAEMAAGTADPQRLYEQPCDARPEADVPGARGSDSVYYCSVVPSTGQGKWITFCSDGRCNRADAAGARRSGGWSAIWPAWWRAPAISVDLHRHPGQYPDLEQGGGKGHRLLTGGVERPPVFRLLRPDRRRPRGKNAHKGPSRESSGRIESNLQTKRRALPSRGLGLLSR